MLAQATCGSSIIFPTIPRLEECHVISRLHLDGPLVVLVLGRAWNKPERGTEPLNLERLHLDATILNWPKLRESLLEGAASTVLVQLCACTYVINSSFEKAASLVEKIQGDKLPTRLAAYGWDERSGEEELAAVWQTANVLGVIIVVLDGDDFGLAHGSACAGLTLDEHVKDLMLLGNSPETSS
jgi:hypothetical protein